MAGGEGMNQVAKETRAAALALGDIIPLQYTYDRRRQLSEMQSTALAAVKEIERLSDLVQGQFKVETYHAMERRHKAEKIRLYEHVASLGLTRQEGANILGINPHAMKQFNDRHGIKWTGKRA